ncbi:MAG: FAD-dependent oxidoreductase [Hyphomicrobiales bacterium]|nr:FAD-dependent oxidoreductase [Hyphomicrobiales bacterium]MDE2114601.1 FAD-dependent oxidoreductase [Hyphomicrobiales bacterium]
MNGTIIIGGGQAGVQVAISLRAGGYSLPIRIIGMEARLPYQRPPLSKAYLTGEVEADHLSLRPADFYQSQGIDLQLGVAVERLELAANRVLLTNGHKPDFDHLILATGSRNRPLGLAGSQSRNVFSLRSLDDASALREAFATAQKVVVIGGGFIGLEFAAVARKKGREVHIVEMQDRLIARAVGPQVSTYYADLHRGHGSHLYLGTGVEKLAHDGGLVHKVVLSDGVELDCDLVVYGIGAMANAELAREAGLTVGMGIQVNGLMQTSHPKVLAVGDCAEHPNPFYHGGPLIRLESVQNAFDQGKAAAATVLGVGAPYHVVPWFWSDQFDAKLQTAGLSSGFDAQVVRGDVSLGKFSVFYFRQSRLIAVDSVNMSGEHMLSRRLLAQARPVLPEQVADVTVDLRQLLA